MVRRTPHSPGLSMRKKRQTKVWSTRSLPAREVSTLEKGGGNREKRGRNPPVNTGMDMDVRMGSCCPLRDRCAEESRETPAVLRNGTRGLE